MQTDSLFSVQAEAQSMTGSKFRHHVITARSLPEAEKAAYSLLPPHYKVNEVLPVLVFPASIQRDAVIA